MKVLCLLVLCFLFAAAQRRTASKSEGSEVEPQSRPLGRGRTRFTTTPEFSQITESKASEEPRRAARRRLDVAPNIDRKSKGSYEVEEVINESPIDPFRRQSKPRVLTETSFEAKGSPRKSLFEPSVPTTEQSLDDIISKYGSTLAATTAKTEEPVAKQEESQEVVETTAKSTTTSTTEAVVDDFKRDTVRNQPQVQPVKNQEGRVRRVNIRARPTPVTEEASTVASRTRVRTRPTRKSSSEATSAAPARIIQRGSRRKAETSAEVGRTRGPSVLQAAETQELPSRSRTGRRIANRYQESPEKITLDLNSRSRSSRYQEPSSTESTRNYRSRGSRVTNRETTTRPQTQSNRGRGRARASPIQFDEQKLEVLPLFEAEAKTVQPPKPETKIRAPILQKVEVKEGRKTKESLVAEITEVTSRRTVPRRGHLRQNSIGGNDVKGKIKVDEPKVTVSEVVTSSRARKKVVKKTNKILTSSEEEIDEEDNYPAPFKALIQAKKLNKESRPNLKASGASIKIDEKVVTSSEAPRPTTITTTTTTEAPKKELENELSPKTTLSPVTHRPRQRFSLSTKPSKSVNKPTKSRFSPSTSKTEETKPSGSTTPRNHRFHAKFTRKETEEPKAVKQSLSSARGLYSIRNKDKESLEEKLKPERTTLPPVQFVKKTGTKKSSRFSSRYRNDISSRGSRSTTIAPVYIPTIPTAAYVPTVPSVTQPTTQVYYEGTKDKDLGLEVITFDDPVNTIPSANLVSGEFLASSTENNLIDKPVVSTTTEKAVSIIERIINSITAISTTAPPEAPTTEKQATDASAILKLAKKPTLTDKAVTVTSEKPTTVIERILSSLSAIKNDESNDIQVGSGNFNTLSSPSTTPLSRVTKSSSSTPHALSTINPLIVLDEISNEQTLQKRTIGKLLDLLNSLTSTTQNPHPTKLVVVTPKASNFLSANPTTLPLTSSVQQETSTIPPQLFSTIFTSSPTLQSRSFPFSNSIEDFSTIFTEPATSVPTSTEASTTSEASSTSEASTKASLETAGTTEASTTPASTTSQTTTVTSPTVVANVTTTSTATTSKAATTTAAPLSTVTDFMTLSDILGTTDKNFDFRFSTKDINNDLGFLPLFVSPGATRDLTAPTTPSTPQTEATTETDSFFTFPSTIPTLQNFEVDVDRNTIPSLDPNMLSSTSVPSSTEAGTTPNTVSVNLDSKFVEDSTTLPQVTTEVSSTTIQSSTSLPTDQTVTTQETTTPQAKSTIPPLTEILNGRTLEAFNDIVNSSKDTINDQTLMVTQYNEVLNIQDLLNKNRQSAVTYRWKPVTSFLDQTSTSKAESATVGSTGTAAPTTIAPSTTPSIKTTTRYTVTSTETVQTTVKTEPPTTSRPETTKPTIVTEPSTTSKIETTKATTLPPTTSKKIETTAIPRITTFRTSTFPTTYFPTFISTLLSTLQPVTTTFSPITSKEETYPPFIVTAQTMKTPTTTVVPQRGRLGFFDTITTTESSPTTTRRQRSTTQPPTTLVITTRAPRSTTTTPPPTTTFRTTTETRTVLYTSPSSSSRSPKKLKELTEEQKKNLQTLAQLEKEQAALLQQLSLLTNLNLRGGNNKNNNGNSDRSSLANRVIALAMDRDRARSTTALPTSIQDQLAAITKEPKKNTPSLEEVLKQYNLEGLENVGSTSLPASTYGTSNEAILASILKERGIGPTTPRDLATIFETTPRPRSTTRRPGRLMQGLNWLLNVLAPPTTQKPRAKKPKKLPDDELLANQPTHITPVVTAPPSKSFMPTALSQEEVKKLIKQLEEIQKNPNKDTALDLSQIKSLQNLLNTNEGVHITTSGEAGATTRLTKRPPLSTEPYVVTRSRTIKSTTAIPVSVSNAIEEEEFTVTTPRPRPSLPPVRLRPVPGVDTEDGSGGGDSYIRGNLITAAVNVTRAISGFLGTALQDAASQLSRVFSSSSPGALFSSGSIPAASAGLSNPSG